LEEGEEEEEEEEEEEVFVQSTWFLFRAVVLYLGSADQESMFYRCSISDSKTADKEIRLRPDAAYR
jgi:hypothetical protein